MRMIVDARQQFFPEFAELASQMNHDLRSPLTAICSYAECLAWLGGIDLQTREKYARAVTAEAHRLGRLSANFLVLAAPQADVDLQQVDLGESLQESLEELSDMTALLETTIEVAEAPEALAVFWSPEVLRQMLTASLEHLLDMAGPEATIRITMAPQGREVAVSMDAESKHPLQAKSEGFALRAAARLAGTRGGSLLLLDGPQPQLRLQVPVSGRLCAAPVTAELGRTA